MRSAKNWLALLICLLFYAPIVPAQDAPQPAAKTSSEVTIIIQQEQVRFAAPRDVAEMRLQVFDQTGELVYDSGAILEPELNWPLQNGNGGALKSGLYAYTLALKEAGREQGKETTRLRRGHFIVDRAKERDGADKLWVTSQNSDGVGAELTVAKDEHATIAGANIGDARVREQRASESDRDDERKEAGERQAASRTNAAAASTAGRIAKFTGANNELGDSIIAEQSGNIGIGTAAPSEGLHIVHTRYQLRIENPAAGGGFWNIGQLDNSFSSGGRKLAFVPNTTNSGEATVVFTNDGKVGIGTTSPLAKFHVVSGASDVLPPRLQSSGATSFAAGWDFYHGDTGKGYVGVPNPQAGVASGEMVVFGGPGTKTSLFAGALRSVTLNTNGNVGIGTENPLTRLHIQSAGGVEATIRSTNERAILALTNTLGPSAYTWTVESGVRGLPGVFGIYNRVVNRSGLEIDGSLNVYVRSLRLDGGADFAENFDVRAETAPAKLAAATGAATLAGMVVAIDPHNPSKLRVSRRAYDRRVAGVISGAGGVKPGLVMGQEGTLADGQQPVALSGRVYVWVDATRGALRPGDLLTTSATPGHAMKATNPQRAQGAIIGKAMTGLKAGKGLVLVLVTLQ